MKKFLFIILFTFTSTFSFSTVVYEVYTPEDAMWDIIGFTWSGIKTVSNFTLQTIKNTNFSLDYVPVANIHKLDTTKIGYLGQGLGFTGDYMPFHIYNKLFNLGFLYGTTFYFQDQGSYPLSVEVPFAVSFKTKLDDIINNPNINVYGDVNLGISGYPDLKNGADFEIYPIAPKVGLGIGTYIYGLTFALNYDVEFPYVSKVNSSSIVKEKEFLAIHKLRLNIGYSYNF